MSEMPQPPEISPPLPDQLRDLLDEANRILIERQEMAIQEVKENILATRQFAVVVIVGALMMLTGLPVLAVFMTAAANNLLPIGDGGLNWWLLILGTCLLVGGLLTTFYAYRRYRSEFTGLRKSLSRVQEDGAWLRDRIERLLPTLEK
jgi:TRAP-type C4-dicarboxylate transport system permease small subunit